MKGKFNEYGGQYVPEILMGALEELEREYEKAKNDKSFKDELNKQVASSNFTLTDDGTIPGALCSSIADDEGTPTEKTTLIEDFPFTSIS